MTYFAQFAKLLTGEVGIVLSTTPKNRRTTLGTRRPDKKGGYETLSIYADALVFTAGSVRATVRTGTEVGNTWWHGHWEYPEDGPWVSFDTAFPSVVEEVSKIVKPTNSDITKPTKSFTWPEKIRV
jgi:hypothetical protein